MSHTQSISAVLCASDTIFKAHRVQLPAPVSLLNVLFAHPVQTAPSGPVKPALHRQSVSASLCAKELVVAGHGAHVGEPIMVL